MGTWMLNFCLQSTLVMQAQEHWLVVA